MNTVKTSILSLPQYFRTLRMGDIFKMGTLEKFSEAFEIYSQSALNSIRFSEEKQTLTSRVSDLFGPEVHLKLNTEKHLEATCDACAGSQSPTLCPHALALLMAATRSLNYLSFGSKKGPEPTYREIAPLLIPPVSDAPTTTKDEPANYFILFPSPHATHTPHIEIDFHGPPLSPTESELLMRLNHPRIQRRSFWNLLQQVFPSLSSPLLLQTAEGKAIPIQQIHQDIRFQLQLDASRQHITPSLISSQHPSSTPLLPLEPHVYFLPSPPTILLQHASPHEHSVNTMHDTLSHLSPQPIPAPAFNNLSLLINPTDLQSSPPRILLTKNSTPLPQSSPKISPIPHKIQIQHVEQDAHLTLQTIAHQTLSDAAGGILELLLTPLLPFYKENLFPIIYRDCFLPLLKKAISHSGASTPPVPDFSQFKLPAQLIAPLQKAFTQSLQIIHSLHALPAILTLDSEDEWNMDPHGAGQFSSMVLAAAHVSTLMPIPHSSPLKFSAPWNALFQQLPTILAITEKSRIPVLLDNLPLQLHPLEIHIKIQPGTKSDHWDVFITIHCNDAPIVPQFWSALLHGKFFPKNADSIFILPQKSRELLQQILTLLPASSHLNKLPSRTPPFTVSAEFSDPPTHHTRIHKTLVFPWLQLSAPEVKLELHPALEKFLLQLHEPQWIPQLPCPPAVRLIPRPYQLEGFSWLAFLYQNQLGACLADDMGLGKTLQTILLLAAIHSRAIPSLLPPDRHAPHLIVLPPTLLSNWQQEIQQIYPHLHITHFTSQTPYLSFRNSDVILTTYEFVRRKISQLADYTFHTVIFDEAQLIKNYHSSRAKACRSLKAHFKLCLTGTPMENHHGEFFSIMHTVLPDLLGTYKSFQNAIKFSPSIIERARPFLLRRTKAQILKDLPPKIETSVFLDPSETQQALYEETTQKIRNNVLHAFSHQSPQQAGILALAALTKLRQLCISPALIDPTLPASSPKFDFLLLKIQELIVENQACLVFSQFTRALDLIEPLLTSHKIPFLRLDGSTPIPKRQPLVQRFQTPTAPPVFLISLRTGGAGLNLTRASHVLHLDPWWNPAVENQASDRAHRIGQSQSVFIHKLILRHSVEEKILALKKTKLSLFEELLHPSDAPQPSPLTLQDFNFLLSKT